MAEDKKKELDSTVIEVTEEYLKDRLYDIRGKRVLLDADLAEIYGYDTKGFNRQVKNNIEKFDVFAVQKLYRKYKLKKPLQSTCVHRARIIYVDDCLKRTISC